MPKIEFKNVSAYYQNKKTSVTALDDLSVSFLSNSVNVIVGFSGSGKSTLLKVLCDIVGYEGSITFDNVDLESIPLEQRGIGYISQEYALFPSMNIFDNIAFPLKNMGAPVEEISKRVHEIAKQLDIEYCLTRKPRHLSGGQQQRVAIARALVKRPKICLLDEPMSNLDAQTSTEIRILLKQLFTNINTTVILVTHDINEATSLGQRIYVMNEGHIVYQGTPEETLLSSDPIVFSLFKGNENDKD